GDVVVGLPTDAETATVSYVPDGATEAVDLEIERNADTGEWESASGEALPTDFTVDGDELTIANSALEDGSDVTVTVADAAGNAAEATLTGVDSAAPAAPTINEGITDQANTVSGTGEAGATVTVREGTTEIGSTTVWTDGNWSFVAASPITDGAELTATQADPAGNVSEPSAAVTTFTDTDGDGVANTSDTDDDGDTPEPVEVEVIDRLIAVEADSSGPIETTIPGTTGPEPSLITFTGNGARSTTSGFRYPEGSDEANVGDTYTLAFDQPITDIKLFLDNMILGTNIGNFTVTYDDGSTASDLVPTVSQANDFNAPRAGGSLTGLGAFTENGFNAVGDIEGTPDASSTQPNDAQAAGTVSFAGLDANKSISEIFWEVTGLTSAVNAETGIGGFVTPIISYDRDPAAFELPDTTEAATESESILSYPAQDPAVNMDIASPSPGYSSSTTTDNSSGSLIDITATAPGESGNLIDTGAGAGVGTVSFFNYRAEVVGNETVEDLSIGISITDFDDGLYVEIDDVVIVSFDASDYAGLPSMAGYDSDGDVAFGFPWAPFNGEGDPELVVDLVNGTVQLLVTESDGTTRSDIFAAMLNDGFDATPNAVPTVDATSPEGVTIGTAFQNSNTNTDDPGSIGVQTITVTGEFGNAADVDVDGIDNWLDIDSDNDGIWDKYEGATDSDGDGVADYRDADSNGATAGDDRSLASLDATGVAALESGTPNTDGFILLSEAVSLDLTGPNVDVTDLEYIDMNDGANAQTMTVDETSLIALTDADNELIIVGDSNDTVDASGFEDTGKDQSIQGQTFDIYEASNGATLIIDEEITVTLA
ncbi:MAG: Ig-like domain-containing protein, partial [Roseovarius sp.]